MSVKIRCSECRKKISVDEAFAGSMCRCPYCKSIVIVPKGIGEAEAAPGRPSRPSAPPGGARPKAPTRPGKGLAGSGLRNVVGSRPIISGQQVASPSKMPSAAARPLITEISKPASSEKDAQDALKALQEVGKQEPTPVPVEPKPVVPKPVEPKPVEPKAAEPKPVEPKPVEPKPAEPKPVEPKQVEPKPVEPKPVEKPVEEKPVETAPEPAPEPEEEEVLETIHVDVSELTPEQLAAIPTANPVVIQGVMALILMGVLVVMLALVIYLGVVMFGQKKTDPDAPGSIYKSDAPVLQQNQEEEDLLKNPFIVQEQPMIGGQVLKAPVAFVIDGSQKMGDGGLFQYAGEMVQASVESLGDGKFAVLVARDPNVVTVTTMRSGGLKGVDAIASTLADMALEADGVANAEKAVEEALKLKPAAVVLLISRKPIVDPKALGKKVKDAGAVLNVVALGSRSGMDETYKQAAEAGGGKALIYGINELQDYYDEAK